MRNFLPADFDLSPRSKMLLVLNTTRDNWRLYGCFYSKKSLLQQLISSWISSQIEPWLSPLMWAITYCVIISLDYSLHPRWVPWHTITTHSIYPATMEKTERALMISLDTLIDTFNVNAEIKTTELANWIKDTVAWLLYRFSFSAKPLQSPASLSAQINET